MFTWTIFFIIKLLFRKLIKAITLNRSRVAPHLNVMMLRNWLLCIWKWHSF